MGKNTMMKRSIRIYVEETGDDGWGNILPHLVGNVGVVFTKGDLNEIRELIQSYKARPVTKADTLRVALPRYVF